MSDSAPIDCATFDEGAAELALELLDTADREALMTHAATCDRCSAELESLAGVADRLTLLAPHGEPVVGFEERAVRAMIARRRRFRAWHAAAVAALLLIGGATIGYLNRRTAPQTQARSAALLDSAGTRHGSVVLTSTEGVTLTMVLNGLDTGTYHCLVRRSDGSTTEVAAWRIGAEGSGVWAVPLTGRFADVRAVLVTEDNGRPVATASLP